MKKIAPPPQRCTNFALLFLMTASLPLTFSSGCQQTPLPGETYRKIAVAWPIFDFEITKGISDDGSTWEKEKGDACCWLSTWEKEKRYDKNNFLIYSKEKSAFFPIFFDEIEESKEFREHKGAVLIFPFYSRKVKSAEAEQPL